jgi:hypothetical protein
MRISTALPPGALRYTSYALSHPPIIFPSSVNDTQYGRGQRHFYYWILVFHTDPSALRLTLWLYMYTSTIRNSTVQWFPSDPSFRCSVIQQILRISRNPKVRHSVLKSPPRVPIFKSDEFIHTHSSYFLTINFDITLKFMSVLQIVYHIRVFLSHIYTFLLRYMSYVPSPSLAP